MRVLGLDSATNVASVAVMGEQHLVAEAWLNTRKTHSQRLMPMLAQLLQEADLTLADLSGLAVAIGPGSFTGLRIGLATVKGLALVTGLPVVGIPTLDALALNAAGFPGIVCPILNARKQEVYGAVYAWREGEMERLTEYLAVSPEALAEILDAYCQPVTLLGDGVPIYRQVFHQRLGNRLVLLPLPQLLGRAAQVAYLGLRALQAGRRDDLHSLKPFYIRPSEAEVRMAQRLAGE